MLYRYQKDICNLVKNLVEGGDRKKVQHRQHTEREDAVLLV